jgi:hypothetical protein
MEQATVEEEGERVYVPLLTFQVVQFKCGSSAI